MSLLAFVGVSAAAALAATLLRDKGRLGTLVGFGGVVAALVAALFVRADSPLRIGGSAFGGSDHVRLVLGLCLAGGLLVLVVTRLATWQTTAPGALLGGAAGIGLALGLTDAPSALLGVAAAAVAASTLALGSPAAPSRIRALARELRGTTTSLAVGLVAAGIVPASHTGVPAEPAAAGLVLVGMALVVAHRFGAVPLHARVSRLFDAAPSGALSILVAWLPAAWGLVIIGWAPSALGAYMPGLGLEPGLIVALALLTLVLGSIAALVQDEVEHVVAYTIVADAGVALLALSALDPGAREAARGWLLVFATTRTAMIGWTIAFRAAFGTGRLRDTTGWLRRAPALGVALAGIIVAAVGWPGLLAWDLRLVILQSAAAGPALLLAYLGSLGTGLALGRVLAAGGGRLSAAVAVSPGELPRLPARPGRSGTNGVASGPASAGTTDAGTTDAGRPPAGRLGVLAVAVRRDAGPTLELNRVPLRAFVVIMLAGLAFLVAAGAFGIDAAARETALRTLSPLVGG